ncbi:MAG TPA: DUF935 family protein [Allosphingosinicella sp.]|nr:DUF935 family protein [Allosphingosinicella sp.]
MSRPPRRYGRSSSRALVPVRTPSRPPAELAQPIATTHDGRDITRPFTYELEEFRDVRLQGAVDWGAYDRILLDDQVKSCLEQRRSAVVSREWSVIPGDAEDPRSVAAAEALEANLERLDWDGITDKMLYASFYGIAIAELLWEVRDGLLQWSDVKVRHARRFRYDKDGRLRLITMRNQRGEVLPDRKFWVVKTGASDDDQPYGRALAEWLYWPTLFKRNGIRFWNIFLDRFSVPPAKGTYPRGTSNAEIEKLLQSMMALANDSGIAVPEGVVLEFMQVATNGIDFEKMPTYMDAAIAKIILSQTMTTDDGSSLAQGKVHAGVKQELITADADLNTGSFTRGPARWFTDFNFGPDVAAPILIRQVEEETDLKATAETDAALAEMGYVRTAESFRDIYGDGFEQKPSPTPTPPALPAPRRPKAANDAEGEPAAEAEAVGLSEPRPLYIHRRLRNAKALIAWAKAQGFKSTIPAAEMHVTIAKSRRPVDWFKIGQAWTPVGEGAGITITAGGPRAVEQLGRGGAIVLRFAARELECRHKEIAEAGASWDYAEYQPHVTLTYEGEGIDLEKIEPYQGELIFGPEIFELLDEDWSAEIDEVAFAEAATADIVDDATAQIMADEGWRQLADELGANELLAELAGAGSQQEVADILRREVEMGDLGPLIERLANAGFAVRMAATAGADGVSS